MSMVPESDPTSFAPATVNEGLPLIAPDAGEEEGADKIDNAVPTSGYGMLPLVGLGGSAGSIGAIQEFLKAMPVDSGMAFVVILHLSPDHVSTLPEIFQRSTTMRVVTATDGAAVEANSVYIIPAGKHLSSTDGHLRLTEVANPNGKRVAVDVFFRTLADTHGPRSVAIVLSGANGDGAIGIKRIKERGGLTIAQDPDEAEHSDMPRSAIATGMVDWVLKVHEIPARLLEYRQRGEGLKLPMEDGPHPTAIAGPASSEDEASLREILAFLHTKTACDFSCYKRATILRRIARRMQVNGLDDLPGYLIHLRMHTGEAGALLQDLLISVTNFFRDRDAFEALERMIPALFKDKGPGDTVRVWVAACATGEEAYSIAMLLCEHARTLEAPPQLQVFATDLDAEVIRSAREGFYPETISADVSDERLRRFFVHEARGYSIRREVREIVLFAPHDLLKDSPFSRLDLISCRNLLIYLNRDAQKRAL
ncbi:MAG: chemotaxis protein CheB, partial [Chthoniobacterales bacterium]